MATTLHPVFARPNVTEEDAANELEYWNPRNEIPAPSRRIRRIYRPAEERNRGVHLQDLGHVPESDASSAALHGEQ
ncbi:hypothetical protein D3C76_1524640 [compost metagenome]